ncbi:hypothetical protein TNCV_4622831 [Trichonephila clavipes]|nr:hypothetical protein TNCV_4622831 [Trichonephila clavipes]
MLVFVVVANLSTVTSEQGPRNSSLQGARFTLVVSRSIKLHTSDSTTWLGSINFEGEHSWGGQRPPTSLLLPVTSREDLRLDGPMPARALYIYENPCLLRDWKPGPTA